MSPGRNVRRAMLAIAALLALGAGTARAETKISDPLEKLNRATYKFNDALDRMALRPLAKLYQAAVPKPARTAVSNFLGNLQYPTTAVNDFLQAKVKDGFSDTARFLVNTTVGIGGLFDPAGHMGLARHDEDFGQTLGYWGVPSGPYLVIPVLGPSDFRDAPARYVDRLTDPTHYTPTRYHKTMVGNVELGLIAVDRRAEFLSVDDSLRSAFDPYVVMRDSYLKHRDYLVHDGHVEDEPLEALPDDPEPATMPKAPQPAAPAEPPPRN
jgi:phospholipid-binding lipoprotein MlaA